MTASKADIQRLIECSICCDYLTEVRETPCCHQLFCYSCIQSWLNKSTKNCPKCGTAIATEQSLLKNIVIQRFVDNLQFECPNAPHGCLMKVSRSELEKHKRTCSYSPDKRAQKQRLKLDESRNLLTRHKEGKVQLSANILSDLAKLFYAEHDYTQAKECLQMINDKSKSPELFILHAHIERECNQYDKALELYNKAYSTVKSTTERIEILQSKGHILVKKAQYDQAKDVFRQALVLLPSDDTSQTKATLLNALGLVAKKRSDVSEENPHLITDRLFLHSSTIKPFRFTMMLWKSSIQTRNSGRISSLISQVSSSMIDFD